MSTLEIVVVIGCLVAGYWYMSTLIDNRSRAARDNRPPPKQEPGGDPWGERTRAHPLQDGQTTPAWHEVLGVAPNAFHEQVVAAYRSKMRQYHPDKVSTLGSEIQALAEQRAKEINAAYAQACEMRSAEGKERP
jgi:DnaJ-domain-containing protein 1